MAGKEIDPVRARSALQVIKQHPGIALFLASPAIITVVLIGVFAGAGWAIVAALAFLLVGGAAVVVKR